MDYLDQYSNQQRLNEEKRVNLYTEGLIDFTKNKKTLVFILVIWVLFLYSTISILLSGNSSLDIYFELQGFNVERFTFIIIFIIILISAVIPIGCLLIFLGSRSNDINTITLGTKIIIIYIKVLKVLIIIFGIIAGFLSLISLFAAPMLGIVLMIIYGGIIALALYIIGIFLSFATDLDSCYKGDLSQVPLANRIKTYFVVICVLTVVMNLISIFIIANLDSSFFDNLPATVDVNSLGEGYTFGAIISMVVQLGILIYYIYFADTYTKHFRKFNYVLYKKKKEKEKEKKKELNVQAISHD